MRRTPGPPTTPVAVRGAATLVLLRPAADGEPGFEVLLTKRPDSMRFGPGMYVFPGGRLEPGEAALDAAVRETSEETGIEVEPAGLVPMTRWVTPYGLPARFDARFFAAIVGAGTDVGHGSDEVAAWSWLRPTEALEGMAAGRLPMWQPTVVTLQQLEGVKDRGALEAAFASDAPSSDPEAGRPSVADERWFETTWAGGVEGRLGRTRVVGRRAWVVVSPPDPTEATVAAILDAATAAGATLAGIVLESLEPADHAGVELFGRGLGLPVVGPPGAAAHAPYEVSEVVDGAALPFGDVPLLVAVTRAPDSAGPGSWSDRVGRLRLDRVDPVRRT